MENPADVQMQWNVRVPLRDGMYLSATLYLPQEELLPAPVIVAMTPYIAQSHHGQGVYFSSRGFPFLVVDVRGRGNSDGAFHPLNEADDGYDVIQWTAHESFCNGKVAMWGGSYPGYCQWATASRGAPHLTTIVPVAAPFRGVDSPVRNNVFSPYSMQWLTIVSGRTSQERLFADQRFWSRKFKQFLVAGRPFKQLDTFIGNPSALFQEWISHPCRDSYWDSHNPTPEQYARLDIPILTITGAYDLDQLGALAHYRAHIKSASLAGRAVHYLIIGPWDHAGTAMPRAEFCGIKTAAAAVIDLHELQMQWYAWTSGCGDKPQFLKNNVAYYVIGAEEWCYAGTLDAATAATAPLFLSSTGNPTDIFHSGALDAEPAPDSRPDQYIYDPRDVAHAELESTVDLASLIDQQMVHAAHGKHLIYHSAPLAKDTTIVGFFKLSAWLAIDTPDTDFRASIYEVSGDGGAVLLTTDWLRARYREDFRAARLIENDTPLRYDFENFMFVARRIPKGDRLRLVLGPINSIHWQKNYNSGGDVSEESMADARPVTVRLFHDAAHPSALYVPYGQDVAS